MGYRVTVLRTPPTYLKLGKEVSNKEQAAWYPNPIHARKTMESHQKRMDEGTVAPAKMIIDKWN